MNPFLLGPQLPQLQPMQPPRPLPMLPMPQPQQQDGGQNMMMGGMGLLGMMKPHAGLLSGLFGPSSTGLGSYDRPAASYNAGMRNPFSGLLGGGV